MKTSLKTGFAQIFSCCPNNLSCPKFGGGGEVGCSPPRPPPARTPMYVVCSGIPLVLYALISSQDDVVSRLLQVSCSPEERFEHLKKIKVVPEKKKQTSA